MPIVAIAKGPDRNAGRETFHVPGREAFRLEPRDPALYFMQRLRDEAHRFAIGTHRAKRSRELVKSPLDEIGGVGPRRKRALLLHFGTVKAIERASLDDLAHTPGVNEATAKAVYDFFHPNSLSFRNRLSKRPSTELGGSAGIVYVIGVRLRGAARHVGRRGRLRGASANRAKANRGST